MSGEVVRSPIDDQVICWCSKLWPSEAAAESCDHTPIAVPIVRPPAPGDAHTPIAVPIVRPPAPGDAPCDYGRPPLIEREDLPNTRMLLSLILVWLVAMTFGIWWTYL
jgi:hypothetical protein